MKKYLLLILISSYLYADNYELKLYEKVLSSIFSKTPIYVYSSENELSKLISSSQVLKIVNSCAKATVLIEKNFTDECSEKPLFATSYKIYKNQKNAFGVFYWRKGRPQLKLNLETMNKLNLKLPSNLSSYAY